VAISSSRMILRVEDISLIAGGVMNFGNMSRSRTRSRCSQRHVTHSIAARCCPRSPSFTNSQQSAKQPHMRKERGRARSIRRKDCRFSLSTCPGNMRFYPDRVEPAEMMGRWHAEANPGTERKGNAGGGGPSFVGRRLFSQACTEKLVRRVRRTRARTGRAAGVFDMAGKPSAAV